MNGSTALLLIDVQKDFLGRPGLQPKLSDLIGALEALLALARSRGWAVFHVRVAAAKDGSNWMPHRKQAGRADCIEGSDGAEPPPSLAAAPGERVITKRFFSAFENPELDAHLATAGTRTLVIAGVHTHACVRSTVTDAYARGFEVLIPREAVGSYDPAHAALTLQWLDGRAARCLPLASL